ncbi:MAG: chlorophyll a/b-binding protein [Cyanobacteria bacterium J06636_16]
MQTPKTEPTLTAAPAPGFGFTRFSEIWNGRLAMLGFLAAIIGEIVTGKGLLAQMGLM